MTKQALFKALLVCSVQAGSVFFAQSAAAQNTSEVGLGLGALNYKGELAPEYRFLNNRPAVSAFYRKDVSAPVTLRGTVTYGLIRANDANLTGESGNPLPLPAYRQANLKGSLLDVAATLEYNFFDFHNRRDKVHFTPYVYTGIAGFMGFTRLSGPLPGFDEKSNTLGLAIPAGVGIKLALSRRWNLGLETGARRALTDLLDHVKDQSPAVANRFDKDWYYYSGVSVSFTFYKINCPDSYGEKPRL
ncbi:type IX secretion system protein PorG [Hymenobacter latericus]|uniref:type IX secretion system protein PorG n=1 Tax=Hymenobacter sp. YIM 151858-1 TaxID=2987688 RepID=UPI002227552E|nr:DUF6089 family protein [Hymenobacter sp. YIM 151858-1]UYZ58710.1 DUF6089 family protein [Hymenobacter sp. YIM 151858-1]